MSNSLLGTKLLPYHHAPTKHNDVEFFGVEYLYRQAGRQFVYPTTDEEVVVDGTDEGFVDESTIAPSISEDVLTVDAGAPGEEEDDDDDDEEEAEDEVCVMHTQNDH